MTATERSKGDGVPTGIRRPSGAMAAQPPGFGAAGALAKRAGRKREDGWGCIARRAMASPPGKTPFHVMGLALRRQAA
jgi:hypothetical protein